MQCVYKLTYNVILIELFILDQVKHDSDLHKEGERGSKMVSEIYLTRLLATKVITYGV